MIQTALVYSGVMLLMLFFARLSSLRLKGISPVRFSIPFWTWENICIILVFILFYGVRYDVGVDHLDYMETYQTGYGLDRYEPIFRMIAVSLRQAKVHFSIYFAVCAFFQIFFILYSIKNERFLFPFLILSLFMGQFFWHWMNVIRQDIAACIYVCAVTFIVERKLFKFLLLIILAIGFHKSSILLLPTYFLLYKGKDWTYNRLFQIFLLWFVGYLAIVKIDVLSIIFPIIDDISKLMEYERYSEKAIQSLGEKTSTGIGLFVFLCLDTLIVLNSKKLKVYYNSKKFIIYYNLYYWGMLLQLFLINNLLLARPVRFFRCFKLLMIAYFLYYLYKHPKPHMRITLLFIVMVLLALLFVSIIVNEPYYFFWSAS